MIFTKKELEFLKVFQSCSEDGDDKLTIISEKESSKVYFTLFTDSIKLIEEKSMAVEEDFNLSIMLAQFNSMLAFCSDADNIEISQGKIKFGNNSEYDFETFDFNKENFDNLLNLSLEGKDISLQDVSKMETVSFAIGQEPEIACIAFQDNHFISYNGTILTFIETKNQIDNNFYLPKMFYKLFQIFKFDSITLKDINSNYFYLSINNLKIYLHVSDYSIPYIFDEGIKEKYEHQDIIVVDKSDLKLALARLKVLNQKTTYNRVFLYLKENLIHLEIKDDFKGYEDVTAGLMDNILKDTHVICNTGFLYDIVNNFISDKIIFKMKDDENLSSIKLEDETAKMNYVLTLYKKYKEEE